MSENLYSIKFLSCNKTKTKKKSQIKIHASDAQGKILYVINIILYNVFKSFKLLLREYCGPFGDRPQREQIQL